MRVSKEWGDDARSRGYHVEPVEYVVTDEDTGQPLTRYDERTFVVSLLHLCFFTVVCLLLTSRRTGRLSGHAQGGCCPRGRDDGDRSDQGDAAFAGRLE